MKKIPSLFQRNYDGDRLVRDEVVPGCEWVLAGGGRATVKYDGTACLVRGRQLFKRYDAKNGKTPPEEFVPAQTSADEKTGHWPGWIPVGDGPEDKWHREAWETFAVGIDRFPPGTFDGTYELVGPNVQGNRHGLDRHILWQHGATPLLDVPLTFEGIRGYLAALPNVEGVVWHHADGRMAKIKRRDFFR